MASNVLDPSALLSQLKTLLPSSSKKLNSPQDGISALLHTALSAVGFRLIAVEDNTPSQDIPGNILPEEWNKNGPSHYTFRYKHEQSSLEFVMKVSKLGGRTMINAIALESDKVASLDISTNDFSSPSFYPYDAELPNARPLVHGFISSNRVADLLSQFSLKIIQKLVPGLRKEGYGESAQNVSTTASSSNVDRRRDGPHPQPQFPYPFENDPLRIPHIMPPRNPLEIGRRDLDPIPMNPFAPPSLFPGNSGDGMFVGPDHPIFDRQGMGGRHPLSPQGLWGGDGYLPPMGAPPGARFDPVGPGPRGPGLGRGGGIPPRRGQDPDNDEFMPPGAGDMFM